MLLAVVSLKCRRPRVTLVILPLGRLTLQNHYLVFHILDKSSWRRGTRSSEQGPWSWRLNMNWFHLAQSAWPVGVDIFLLGPT